MKRTELEQRLNGLKNELAKNYRHFQTRKIGNVDYATKKIVIKLMIIDCEKAIKMSESEVKKLIQRERKI